MGAIEGWTVIFPLHSRLEDWTTVGTQQTFHIHGSNTSRAVRYFHTYIFQTLPLDGDALLNNLLFIERKNFLAVNCSVAT